MSNATRPQSTLDAHLGKMLLGLARSTYTTLPRAILEAVQNALDADADTIHVVVDLPTRQVWVRDDGDGVTVNMFNQALGSISDSGKEADKLGRWGLGLISPLDKAKCFRFTSIRNGSRRSESAQRRRPRGVYVTWTFSGEDIETQRQPIIPREDRTDICHSSTRQRDRDRRTAVPWISELHIEGFTTDRGKMDRMSFELLQELILSKFGKVMAQRDVKVHLQYVDADGTSSNEILRPSQYRGVALDAHRVPTDVGPVEFHLHVVRDQRKRAKGNIHFFEWDSEAGTIYPQPITVTELLQQAQTNLSAAAREALNSGVFEGEIWVDGAKMDPGRDKFVYDDSFFHLLIAIDTWWEDVGKLIWADIQEERDSTRWGELGRRAMRSIEQTILGDERFSHLLASIRDLVPIGTIGSGHTEPKPKDRAGDDPKGSTRGSRGGTDRPREGEGSSGSRGGGGKEDVDDVPTTVTGGESDSKPGRRRRRVKGSSMGIQLDHDEVPTSSALIHVDWQTLTITLNTRSPQFVACDEKNRWLQHLQEWTIVEVLHILPHVDRREWLVDQLNSRSVAQVVIIQGDERRRRREPGR